MAYGVFVPHSSPTICRVPNKRKILIIAVAILAMLAWSPWVTSDYAKKKVISSADFRETHPEGLPESEIHVTFYHFFELSQRMKKRGL